MTTPAPAAPTADPAAPAESSPCAAPCRTARGRLRREALLEAAQALFLERGYAATCVDDVIARVGGGSKASVYRYFGNKEGLFGAIIAARVDEVARNLAIPAAAEAAADADVEARLCGIARRYSRWLFTGHRANLRRVVFAEAPRCPELAQRYYDATQQVRTLLADYLAAQHRAERLVCEDAHAAAALFMSLLEGDPLTRQMLGLPSFADEAALEEHVTTMVGMFMRGYARQPSALSPHPSALPAKAGTTRGKRRAQPGPAAPTSPDSAAS